MGLSETVGENMNKKDLFDNLNFEMLNDSASLNKNKNPVVLQLKTLEKKQLVYVVSQYSIFTKSVVSMLLLSRDTCRKNGMDELDTALTRNIGEELGTETDGVGHSKMLLIGLAEGTGIDASTENPSESTEVFISEMKKILSSQELCFVLGGSYALESSAMPELKIVLDIINKIFLDVKGFKIPSSTLLATFFEKHLNIWEPRHEDDIKKWSREKIKTDSEQALFENGFRDVVRAMDKWWRGLAKEMGSV